MSQYALRPPFWGGSTAVVSVFAALWLGACTPPESRVTVDGAPVADLVEAAQVARTGSEIVLEPGVHPAGVTLPADVHLRGPGAILTAPTGATDRVIEALGDLRVTGVAFEGGGHAEGSALYVGGDLVLDGASVTDSTGDVAVRVLGELDLLGSTIEHESTAIRVLIPTGRPPRLAITDSVVSGLLDIPADDVVIDGLTGGGLGDPRIQTFGHTFRVDRSQLGVLEITGPATFLTDTSVSATATLDSSELLALNVSGGAWNLEVEELTATGWLAETVRGRADHAEITTSAAERFDLEGQSITVGHITADTVSLDATVIAADNIRARQLELDGSGTASRLSLEGASPSVYFGPMDVVGVMIRSTSGPVRARMDGTLVRGMAVVEPPGIAKEPSLDTNSFANVFNLTWHGQGASTFTDDPDQPSQLHLQSSILSRASAAPWVSPVFANSVVWHPDQIEGDIAGAIVADPLFVSPTDPHLAADSPFVALGAFAGDTGPIVEALWDGL